MSPALHTSTGGIIALSMRRVRWPGFQALFSFSKYDVVNVYDA
jgi:hypothetical protein